MDSITAVQKFIQDHNIERGQPFQANINIQMPQKPAFPDTATAYIFYDVGYAQFRIEIEWSFGDDIMHALRLRGNYNTNFQIFEVDDTALIIQDSSRETRICIFKQEEDQR